MVAYKIIFIIPIILMPILGVLKFVPDEFVSGVLDYYFAIGVWGFGQVFGDD